MSTKFQLAEKVWHATNVLGTVIENMQYILENTNLFLDGEARVTMNRSLKALSALQNELQRKPEFTTNPALNSLFERLVTLKTDLEKELAKPLFDPNEKPFYKT